MRSRFVRGLAIIGCLLNLAADPPGVQAHSPDTSQVAKTPLKFGAYDPTDALGREALSYDHHFVSWLDLDRAAFQTAHKVAAIRGRDLLITVEPFTTSSRRSFFQRILSGGYDPQIKTVCGEIGKFGTNPLVRWGHEMDDTSGRYPWAQPDSDGYVRAYRYFVDSCRGLASNARFVWSPIGNKSPTRYYPGDRYVDFVGLPIWGLQTFDRHYYGKARPFEEILGEKYKLVRQHGKPIIVAEFGVSGSSQYKQFILAGIGSAPKSFPLLHSVIYFNMKEPYHWPGPFGSPDWRIGPGQFATSLSQ